MAFVFSVVGIGPGSMDYLLPMAKKEVEHSDIIVGGSRHLELFSYTGLPVYCLDGQFSGVIDFIKKNRVDKKIAVVVSGDPGFYSLLGIIERNFNKAEYTVIPGLSSFQLAFSRIKMEWKDAEIISLHGKSLNILNRYIFNSATLGILTDYKNTPFRIADYIKNRSSRNRKIIIAENLSYPDEKIIETDIYTISEGDSYKICIMIIV